MGGTGEDGGRQNCRAARASSPLRDPPLLPRKLIRATQRSPTPGDCWCPCPKVKGRRERRCGISPWKQVLQSEDKRRRGQPRDTGEPGSHTVGTPSPRVTQLAQRMEGWGGGKHLFLYKVSYLIWS